MIKGKGVNPIVSNFEVTVEKLVYGGDGLARLEGRVVFVPFVLPGERVRAEVEQEKPGWLRARPLEVVEPAAARVAPPCPYFARCGGCHYQHAPYQEQLSAKREILAEELRRLGKIAAPNEVDVISAEPLGYRNRAQFHIQNGRLGYWEARSHNLCAIEACPISSPKVNGAIRALNGMLRDPRWPPFVRSLEVFTDERQVQLNVLETERPVARRFFDWCAETISGLVSGPLDYQGRFRVSGNSFFQVNRFLADRLVETAIDGARGETALDLFAGVGLFSLALAERFGEIGAVESAAGAVRDLEFNAARAGRSNLRAEHGSAEAYLTRLERAPDFVLLDPPRAGLGKAVVRRLIELRPPDIAIVSCDPATLARDLAGLTAAGYQVERMTLVDLFPQTFHLETVVRLKNG
ncbi:MAG TPA: class I SAM-dependent RNA methyltransferase [Bryobacteraceae bacterium]|nr:class I SAM-dependent RNA methyltransferase [Bryobacteraceae bacterium]